MFEKRRTKKEADKYQESLAQWTAQCDGYTKMLELAKSFHGGAVDGLVLTKDEAVFFYVTGASLVEDRRGAGHYQGGSTGVSIPIGAVHGRSVRYRVGATRGHYVQGTPTPTAIDQGTVFITNKRVIFQGAKQTRECAFAKLIGYQHDDAAGSTTFSVSNRQKATTVHYGSANVASFDFRFDLALAHYKNTVDQLLSQMQADLAQIESERPVAPTGVAG